MVSIQVTRWKRTIDMALFLVTISSILCKCNSFSVTTQSHCHQRAKAPRILSTRHASNDNDNNDNNNNNNSPINRRIYFDISINNNPIGRLTFRLSSSNPLPLHTENIIKLCNSDRTSIDPSATYVGCAFDYGRDYIESLGNYRWSHVLRGRGRNAVGVPTDIIREEGIVPSHSCFGGSYYGSLYEDDGGEEEGDCGVRLTVPMSGPGRGSTRLAVVRVGESPPAWKERLLLNSAIIGVLEEGLDTLHAMARQEFGPPVVTASGVLE